MTAPDAASSPDAAAAAAVADAAGPDAAVMTACATDSIRAASCADDYDPGAMPVDRARRFIDRFVAPIGGMRRVPIRDALGQVLAEDVVSPFDVPLADNSAMDGYALRHADVDGREGVTLKVVGTAYAGRTFDGTVAPGECIRIMTGGVVTPPLDCVVPQEHTRPGEGIVTVGGGLRRAQNVRHAGYHGFSEFKCAVGRQGSDRAGLFRL